MNNEVLLSIIVPMYNVEKYIQECVGSIIKQLPSQVEVIVIDDGATDDSAIICKKMIEGLEQVTIVHQVNGGLSAARNRGIRESKGKYLLFLDSDDKLSDNGIEIVLNGIKNNTDICWGKAYTFQDGCTEMIEMSFDTQDYHKSPAEWFLKMNSQKHFYFTAWMIVIKRQFLVENDLYFQEGILHEDELWVPRVMAVARTMEVLQVPFYCYRLGRAGSIVATPNIKREFDKLLIVDILEREKYLDKYGKKLYKSRMSALVFGIILKLNSFRQNDRYLELVEKTCARVDRLKAGKYRGVWLITKVLGVERVSVLIHSIKR